MNPAMNLLAVIALASLPLARADEFRFEADPLTIGNLALWSIFSFLFLGQTIACTVALIVSRGKLRRTLFAVLLAAAFFSLAACVAATSFVVIANNALGVPAPHVIPGLDALQSFSYNWSLALLYLAVVLVFADRHGALESRGAAGGDGMWAGRRLSVFSSFMHYGFFVLLFVLGTAAAGLVTSYENLLYTAETLAQLSQLNRIYAQYTKVNYIFTALWCVTALDVVALAVQLFRAWRRAGVSDYISKVLVYALTPLYFLLIVSGLAFTVLFSPAGLKITPSTYSRLESSADADVILLNLFYFLVALVLVILGLKRNSWEMRGGASGPHVKLQEWPSGKSGKDDRNSFYTMNSQA